MLTALSPATAAYPPARFSPYAAAAAVPQRATGMWGTPAPRPAPQVDTRERLLLTRFEKLLPLAWSEWEAKLPYLRGIDASEALGRLGVVLLAVPLAATAITVGFTFEQSLYVRAELPAEWGGTLYAEVNLGSEADAEEDTFVAIRQQRHEQWSASGAFSRVLPALSQYLAR